MTEQLTRTGQPGWSGWWGWSPVVRTWVVALALAGPTTLLLTGPVRDLTGPAQQAPLAAVVALAAVFVVAELAQVHLDVRGETHTVTFAEVPLVVGLFVLSPGQLAVALGAASVLVRLLWLRQAAVKQVFNLTVSLLDLCVVVLITSAAGSRLTAADPRDWAWVLAATLTSSVISSACVSLVIWASDPEAPLALLAQTSATALGVTAVNTATGLAGAALVQVRPVAALLLVVPAVMLLLAYRAYASQLQERRRVDFLLAFNRALHEGPSPAAGVGSALLLAEQTLHTHRMVIVAADADAALAPLVQAGGGQPRLLIARGRRREDAVLAGQLAAAGVEQAMVAPLQGRTGERGALLALGRQGSVSRFSGGDLALLGALAEQLALVLERNSLADSLDTLRSLQDQLVHTASHDPLTGLANRFHLLDQLGGLLEREADVARFPAVLFIDLDGFKGVNDRLGHAAGDEVLKAVAERLQEALGPDDLAARLGGDEFVAVLAHADSDSAAVQTAQQVCRQLTAPLLVAGRSAQVGASVGVARAGSGQLTAEELLERADEVMYEAKSRAGGVQLYDSTAHTRRTQRRTLHQDLAQALRHDALDIAYQPIVALPGGELTGVEALARWHHPQLGAVTADVFVPLAEATGLINELGQAMLRASCQQLARWQSAYPRSPITVSVNVSARELQQDTYADTVEAILVSTGADPTRLIIEVTESLTLGDEHGPVRQLEQLRARGVRVAIDDFGSGYASLHQLRVLPIDILKLDRSLLAGAVTSADERAMLQAVIQLGAALRVDVIVEGIETPEQQQLCRHFGVPLGQGWLFGRPGPAADIDAQLAAAGNQHVLPFRRRA